MLLIVIVASVIVTESVQAGYFYPRPKIVFELPKNGPNFQEGFAQKTIQKISPQALHETVVSYSLPFQDYYHLHQNKGIQQTRPNVAINAQPVQTSVSISTVNTLPTSTPVEHTSIGNTPPVKLPVDIPATIQSLKYPLSTNHHHNNHHNNLANSFHHFNNPTANIATVNLPAQHNNLHTPHTIDIPAVNLPNVNFPASIYQQSSLAVNTFPNINIPTDNSVKLPIQLDQQSNIELNSVNYLNTPAVNLVSDNLPALIQQQSNVELTEEQHIIGHDVHDDLNGQIIAQTAVSPKITKHIYFHVPPPELEEPVRQVVTPKKKIYKILFIKVPSQESARNAQLQQLANQVASIEDKTIIYVLSKKPEPQQIVLPKSVPSEHEVLFVKYSGDDPVTSATLGNGNLDQQDSELLLTPTLQRGEVNGKQIRQTR